MSGAASIQSSSAAPPSGVSTKQKQNKEAEGEAFGLSETSIFAEFLSFFEGDETTLETELTSKDEKDKDEDATALQIEMMHLSWFSGEKGTPEQNQPVEAKQAFVFVKPNPESLDFETNDPSAPMPPFAISDWNDNPENNKNNELLYRLVPQEPLSGRWGAKVHEEGPQPIHPSEIAETLAKVELAPKELLKPAPQVEAINANADSQPRTPAAATPPMPVSPSKGNETMPANVKASLSALESMLMQQNSGEFEGSTADNGKSALIEKAIKEARISSIRQETHHSFGLSQSPVLQIAQRITHEIQIGRNQMADQADLTGNLVKPPVRVLHIQLDPPQLGPLTIRMSLQNELLTLQLETPHHETAHLIQNDKDSLSKLLRSAGYTVDGLNIQVTAADRGSNSPSSNLGGGFGQTAGEQPGWRQPKRQGPDDGWRRSNQDNNTAPTQKDASNLQSGKPRSGAVYI